MPTKERRPQPLVLTFIGAEEIYIHASIIGEESLQWLRLLLYRMLDSGAHFRVIHTLFTYIATAKFLSPLLAKVCILSPSGGGEIDKLVEAANFRQYGVVESNVREIY